MKKYLALIAAFALCSCQTDQPSPPAEAASTDLIVGAQTVTAGPASAVLATLGVKGVTATGGTTAHANYLVKLNADGELPAAVIPSSASDLDPLSRIVFIDQSVADDSGDGSVQQPFKTLAGAWAAATGPATYVFTPGDHFVPGSALTTDAKFPFTLLALDPSNTTLYRVSGGATTALSVSTTTKAANITVSGVKLHGISQLANFALNVTALNMGAVTNMTRASATYAYSLTHDATVTTVPTLGANATTNRLDNASRVEFAPSNSSAFGASSMTTKAALDKLMSTAIAITNALDIVAADASVASNLTDGTLPAGRMPALTGDVTSSVGTVATTIASGAVTSAKILDGTIAAADMAVDSVTSAKILDGTIVAADLANSTITSAKLATAYLPTAGGTLTGNVSVIPTSNLAVTLTLKPLEGAYDAHSEIELWGNNFSGPLGWIEFRDIGDSSTDGVIQVDNDGPGFNNRMLLGSGAGHVIINDSGVVQVGPVAFPTADGTEDQFLKTDGAGTLTWSTPSWDASAILSGTLAAARMPALTGDVTSSAGAVATTVGKWKGLTLNGTPGASNVGDTWVYNHGTTSFDLKHVDNRVVPIVYATTIGASSPLNMTSIAYTNTWVTITINDNGNATAGATVVLGQAGSVYPQYLTVSNKDLDQTLTFTPSVSGTVFYIYPGTTAHFVNRSSANTFDHVLVSPDYSAVPALLTVLAPGTTTAGAQLSVPTTATAYLNMSGDSNNAAGATLAAIAVTDSNSLAGGGTITFKSDLNDTTGRMILGVAGATSAATIYSDSRIVLGTVKLSGITETETQGLTMSTDADDGTTGDKSLAGVLLYRKTTTSATPFALTSAECAYPSQYFAGLALPANSACTATVTVTAKQRSSANTASYVYIASATNNAGTSALEGSNTAVREVEDTAGWGAAVTVDDTLDALLVTLTGEAATTIDWTVKVDYTLDISGP